MLERDDRDVKALFSLICDRYECFPTPHAHRSLMFTQYGQGQEFHLQYLHIWFGRMVKDMS